MAADRAGPWRRGRAGAAEGRPRRGASQRMSLRKISAELAVHGHLTARGRPYVASAVQAMFPGKGKPHLTTTGHF